MIDFYKNLQIWANFCKPHKQNILIEANFSFIKNKSGYYPTCLIISLIFLLEGTAFPSLRSGQPCQNPLHHSAHAAHTAHIRYSRFFFRNINNGCLGCKKHCCYGSSVFKSASCYLCRVNDTSFKHIDKFIV